MSISLKLDAKLNAKSDIVNFRLASLFPSRNRRGRNRMVVGFTTTCTISPYHQWSCEFEPRSWRDVLDTILCDNVCLWLATGQWFSPGTPVSSTNTNDRHDMSEILLKVALNTITLTSTTPFQRDVISLH